MYTHCVLPGPDKGLIYKKFAYHLCDTGYICITKWYNQEMYGTDKQDIVRLRIIFFN